MIRVVLVAPVLAMRAGLRALLESGEEVAVIAEANAIGDLDALPPDSDILVLASETLSPSDLARLTSGESDFALLLVTDDTQAAQIISGLPVGVWGILSLEASAEELLSAVGALHNGLLVGEPALMATLLSTAPGLTQSQVEPLEEPLTERENEVLQLLAQGLANKQIAHQLGISEHTVKFHVSSIYAKLDATNRAEAVRQGIVTGLVVL
ncbi:MAG TPA: response regulator transcription factor [Anaerolineales bacterium]